MNDGAIGQQASREVIIIGDVGTYEAYRAAVDGALRAALAGREGMLYDLLRYHLGWVDEQGNAAAGAQVRLHYPGALALAAAEAVSGEYRRGVTAAASVELAYNFVLVHNEVQAGGIDRADNRPSIWWVWGPSQAINAGDGLHALARAALMGLSEEGLLTAAETLEALGTLDEACLALCEGQYLDLTYQEQLLVSESDYMDMAGRKSGSLAGAAARLGAVCGGADGDTAGILAQWGAKLGVARQLGQDIAELWGPAEDGFSASNALNKKKSLPLIRALQAASPAVKRELGAIYMKRVLEPEDGRRIVAILDETGAREYAAGKASELAAAASELVSGLTSGAGGPLRRPQALAMAAGWMRSGGMDVGQGDVDAGQGQGNASQGGAV